MSFHPYGNAPRVLDPWRPQVNLVGRPTVQLQPNPYFAHWPQNLGTTDAQPACNLGVCWPLAVAAAVSAYLLADILYRKT